MDIEPEPLVKNGWLTYLTLLEKCTKGQSNRSILSKVIVLTSYKSTDSHTQTHRHRQTHSRNPFFRVQRISKCGHLTKTGVGGGGEYFVQIYYLL